MMPHMMEEGEVIDLDAKPPPPPPYEMTGTSESFSDAYAYTSSRLRGCRCVAYLQITAQS